MPDRLLTGDLVRARGDEWRIADVARGEGCLALTLVGVGPGNSGGRRVLLSPFDRVGRLAGRGRSTPVGLRRWLGSLRALLSTARPDGHLRAAAAARITLLPYQLEPAIAAVRGHACRFLLADAVGLGKTIQAGLMLAELLARGEVRRCLVLTPVGLRDQWVDELATRFSIPAIVVDRRLVRETCAAFPTPVSPWTLGTVFVTSCDYAKRPDVLAGLAAQWWDLLIVDEAHAATAAAGRGHLVERIGARARRIALLTATPHAGDPAAFSRLCRAGALDDGPVLMFRRTRADAGLVVTRRVVRLAVTPTPDERRMHAVLARYTRAAWTAAWGTGRADALLALVVLNKRALSSASSLYTSVERRLRLLAEPAVDWRQPGFRFDEDGEADADDEAPVAIGCPALADTTREREYLEALAAAAGRAAGGESKLAALRRLLRRIDEPAIVFTEFRDTLAHVARTLPSQQAAILHGGLTRGERIAAEQAFVSGATPLLLATDAAGEGLNLQARCRFVINLELPWNPRRLEQRIGRVDRIGQRGVVHALHLVARDTGEARVLARLAWKLERARDALGAIAADAVGLSERELLGAMVGRRDAPAVLPEAVEAPVSTPPLVRQVSLRAEAEREAREVQTLRRIQAGAAPAARLQPEIIARHLAALDRSAPLIGVARRGALSRLTGGPGLLVVYRVRIVTDAGRAVEEALIPITCATGPGTASRSPQVQRVLVEALLRQPPAALARLVDERVAWHLDIVRAGCRPRLSLLAERERLMAAHADAMADLAGQLVQQGLFDRRAVRDAARQARERLHDRKSAAGRLAAVEADGLLRLAAAPEPVLVLFVAGESRGRSSHTARGDGR